MSLEIEQLAHPAQIRLILAVNDAKRFTGAAANLGVSRTLFERTRTGVRLTADGNAVLIYARAMSQLTDDLKRHFMDGASVIRISVGMSEDFCRTALPTNQKLYIPEHPK